jgi:hypothetical protein
MAKATEILDILSDACGIGRPAIALYAQKLRNAGLVSKGGRGVNAAHWGTTDTVNVLIAILSNATPGTVADNIRAVRALPNDHMAGSDMFEGLWPDAMPLVVAGSALDAIIDAMRSGAWNRWIENRTMLAYLAFVDGTRRVEFTFVNGDTEQSASVHFGGVLRKWHGPLVKTLALDFSEIGDLRDGGSPLLQRLAAALGPLEK